MQIKVTIGAVVGVAAGLMLAVGAGCSSDGGNPTDHPVPGLDAGTHADGGTDAGADAGISVTVQETLLVIDSSDAGATADGGTGARIDPNLVNPWGLAITDAGNIWISNNGTGTTSVYNTTGAEVLAAITIPPAPGSDGGTPSAPTGVVWNPNPGSFGGDHFLFATEEGTIAGWNSGPAAAIRADNSASGAVYKGIAIANDRLFVANFNSGKVDVYNSSFQPVGQFSDPNVPAGFAPFNVLTIDGTLYVTFARQDQDKEDDVPGVGNGFIDSLDPMTGTAHRLVSNGPLNSPWGLAIAPGTFGGAAGQLIVGNFGDGLIHLVNPSSGEVTGQFQRQGGAPLSIDGLWGLSFVPGATGSAGNTLFFTAGPNDEANGQFGTLTPVP